MAIYLLVVALVLISSYNDLQVQGMPTPSSPYVPKNKDVALSPLLQQTATLVCAQSIEQMKRDLAHNKRDDVFINLILNICLPAVSQESLEKLLFQIHDLLPNQPDSRPSGIERPAPSGNERPAPSDANWDEGLLPEVDVGQEGIEDIGGVGGDGNSLDGELPPGYLPETGPGQEGIDDTAGDGNSLGGELPTGYLPETGPGQEGIDDTAGDDGNDEPHDVDEEDGDQDGNSDNWWKRVIEEIISEQR